MGAGMQLTPMRTLMLWALLGRGGAAFAKDIRPDIEKADREALENLRLIRIEKRNKAYWLEVTDTGVQWAAEHLADPLPNRSTAGSLVLRDWLAALQVYMRATSNTLNDLLAPPTRVQERPPEDEPPSRRPKTEGNLHARVREAYLATTGGRLNVRALLRDIRQRLSDVSREALDAELRAMHRGGAGAMLITLENPREITSDVAAAAVTFSGKQMHALWISQ
jgi:hypothetical protein